MNNETLMAMTSKMPMKTIEVNGQPYLERYFAGYTEDGGQWWYHRFLRSDSERHLHTHPWTGTAMILRGKYVEHLRPVGNIDAKNDRLRTFRVGKVNEIFPTTLHRIVEVEPDTWTLLNVAPGRTSEWKFIAEDGSEVVMKPSPENWHETCHPRETLENSQGGRVS